MTTFKSLFILILTAFLFVQCKSSKVNMKKPEDVSLAFLRAFSTLEFGKAKQYATPETQQLMNMVESMMAGIGEDEKKKLKAESQQLVKAMKTAKCTINGDMASCIVCCGPDGSENPEATQLKKIDGKWFVHMDKNAMGGDEE